MTTTMPHILIVDDDVFQRDFLRLIVLHFFPHARVTTVTTGYDALVTYQTHGIDVLILDHYLPDVLGNALLQYLRETGAQVPTILVSGLLPREEAQRDARTAFLRKPVLLPEFLATLRRFMTATGEPRLTE